MTINYNILKVGSALQFNNNTISHSGNFTATSGNFGTLQVNGTGVSLSGHNHISSNITDFNSSVSGLLPVKNIVGVSGININNSSGNYTVSTQFATTTESRQILNTSVVANPATIATATLNWTFVPVHAFNVLNGATASLTTSTLGGFFNTGTTANGSAQGYAAITNTTGFFAVGSSSTDWTLPRAIKLRMRPRAYSTNGIIRAHFGFYPTSYQAGGYALSVRGIGLELRGSSGQAWIVAHNGTTLTQTDTGISFTVDVDVDILLYSDGTGIVTLYRNGTSIGTSSGGPSTQGTNSSSIRYEVVNMGDSSAVQCVFSSAMVTTG